MVFQNVLMDSSRFILDLLKKNESEAFQLLFDKYYDNLLLYCYHILNDLETAEDIVQDCFIYLWNNKRLHSFTGDLDRFIFRVVKNNALLFLREHKKRFNTQILFYQENFDDEVIDESSDVFDSLYQVINKLPEKCRKVFLMACLNDRTYQEIATELGISINTVKTQMKTALRYLRENLQENTFSTLLYFLTKKI